MPTSSTIQLVMEQLGEDVSAVTRLLGLEPIAVGRSEKNTPPNSPTSASWIFEIAMPETESVEGQALALLRFLDSHAEAIRQAAACYPASIAIGIADHGTANSGDLTLVPLIAAQVAKLGLGIRIHISPLQN